MKGVQWVVVRVGEQTIDQETNHQPVGYFDPAGPGLALFFRLLNLLDQGLVQLENWLPVHRLDLVKLGLAVRKREKLISLNQVQGHGHIDALYDIEHFFVLHFIEQQFFLQNTLLGEIPN